MSSSSAQETSPDEQWLMRLRIATELLGLAYTIYVIWILLVPEHQRRLMMMRLMGLIRNSAGKAAFRTAHQAMGLEIRGHGTNYELPYRLSLVREWARREYDKLRYTA